MSDSTDPVADYKHALDTLKTARSHVDRVVGPVVDAANLLRGEGWKHVVVIGRAIPGQSAGTGFRPLPELPTMQQIGDTLLAWHQARAAVDTTWAAVPQEMRQGAATPRW